MIHFILVTSDQLQLIQIPDTGEDYIFFLLCKINLTEEMALEIYLLNKKLLPDARTVYHRNFWQERLSSFLSCSSGAGGFSVPHCSRLGGTTSVGLQQTLNPDFILYLSITVRSEVMLVHLLDQKSSQFL